MCGVKSSMTKWLYTMGYDGAWKKRCFCVVLEDLFALLPIMP